MIYVQTSWFSDSIVTHGVVSVPSLDWLCHLLLLVVYVWGQACLKGEVLHAVANSMIAIAVPFATSVPVCLVNKPFDQVPHAALCWGLELFNECSIQASPVRDDLLSRDRFKQVLQDVICLCACCCVKV